MKNKFKKLKRCIIFFAIFVLVFSFSFSVAAFETYYINMPITQPTISDTLSYFEVSVRRPSDGAVFGYTFIVSHDSFDKTGNVPVSLSFYDDGTRHIMKIYNNSQGPVTASAVDSEGKITNFKTVTQNGEAIEYRLPYSIVTVKTYGNIEVRDYSGFNTGSIVFQYGSTAQTNKLLASILAALEDQSGSSGSIVGAIEGSTDEIMGSIDSNTDKILNSGEYDDIDESGFDEHQASQEALDSSLEEGYTKVDDALGSFASIDPTEFKGSHIGKGLFGASNLLRYALPSPFDVIIEYSLFLGCIGFLIGITINLFRRSS